MLNKLQKILICDDHPICQAGIQFSLQKLVPSTVKFLTASSGKNMLALFQEQQPDIVVLDLNLPDISGIELIKKLQDRPTQVRIIVITSCEDVWTLSQIQKTNINALLWKTHELDTLQAALNHVQNHAKQTPFIDPNISRALNTPETSLLTVREWEVLSLIAKGLTNEAIAQRLACATETVKTHRSKIGQKTMTRNRSELTAWFLQRNGKTDSGPLIED